MKAFKVVIGFGSETCQISAKDFQEGCSKADKLSKSKKAEMDVYRVTAVEELFDLKDV